MWFITRLILTNSNWKAPCANSQPDLNKVWNFEKQFNTIISYYLISFWTILFSGAYIFNLSQYLNIDYMIFRHGNRTWQSVKFQQLMDRPSLRGKSQRLQPKWNISVQPWKQLGISDWGGTWYWRYIFFSFPKIRPIFNLCSIY